MTLVPSFAGGGLVAVGRSEPSTRAGAVPLFPINFGLCRKILANFFFILKLTERRTHN